MTELPMLIEAMCQGTATYADRDRLEKLLQDPASRAEYLAAARLHSELLWRWHRGRALVAQPGNDREMPGAVASPAASAGASRRGRLPSRRFAAFVGALRGVTVSALRFLTQPAPLACLVAAGVLGAFLIAAGRLGVDVHGDSALAFEAGHVRPVVARVTGLHAVRWGSPDTTWRHWDTLPKGTRIDVAAGLVQVTHLDGAKVVIEGPASYQVLSPMAGRLIHGRMAARTEHDQQATSPDGSMNHVQNDKPLFTVRTPTRLVHDLGTEFGVQVTQAGDAGVHVFEGLVELAAIDHAPARDEVPIRLGVGESAGIDEAGRIGAASRSLARRFVRSLPNPPGEPRKSFLEQIGWSDASAEVIYRDAFAGKGPFAGTTSASRGGVGNAAWVAPDAWGIDPSHGALVAAGPGTAMLPFQAEAGWLYRISIDLDVIAGGPDWFAVGLTSATNTAEHFIHGPHAHAWMGQRHETNHSGCEGNFVFRGPGREGLVMPVDFATGRQRRSILLDTRGRTWRAYFLLGDEPVATCSYATPPTAIANIALSQYRSAHTRVHGFSVARLEARVTQASADDFEEKTR